MTRVLKLARPIAGFGLLILGAVLSLPGIPGPGLLVILAGLWMLSPHFTWARKALRWCKRKIVRLRRSVRRPA
jgi:hypothetical protein